MKMASARSRDEARDGKDTSKEKEHESENDGIGIAYVSCESEFEKKTTRTNEARNKSES